MGMGPVLLSRTKSVKIILCLVGNGTFSPTFLSSNFTSMLIFISSTLESVLTKEFDRLKDNYHRCIRKREKMTRSGCAGTKLPPVNILWSYPFYEIL